MGSEDWLASLSVMLSPQGQQPIQEFKPCQAKFLKDQLEAHAMPTAHIDGVRFVSGLDSKVNFFTRRAFNGGAVAVTQGSTARHAIDRAAAGW
jgi:hypothetical protein